MNKKLIAILTLVMFAITLLPMGAFAATSNVGLQSVLVSSGNNVLVSDLRLSETEATMGSIKSGNTVTLTPLNGVKFTLAPITLGGTLNTSGVLALVPGTFTPDSVTYKITGNPAANIANSAVFSGIRVDTTNMSGNDVIFNVATTQPSGFTPGDVVLGTKSSKSTKTTVLGEEKLQLGKADQKVGTIRITENIANSFAANGVTKTIKIQSTSKDVKLLDPALYPVATPLTPNIVGGGIVSPVITFESENVNADGFTAIVITVTGTNSGQSFIDIPGILVQVTDKATLGDIKLKVSGTGDVTTETVVVGSIRDYGVILSAPSTLTTLFAGDETEEVKTFYVEETGAASIIGNKRTLKLTLPVNTAWKEVPNMQVDKGDNTFAPFTQASLSSLEDNGRTAVYTMAANGFSNSATKFKFTGGYVAAKATAKAGDLTVTLSGSSNVAGEVVIGSIEKPVIVEASSADVQIGKNNQAVGDIMIKEVKAGYIKAAAKHKTIIIRLPENVKASSVPTVEVVQGDLKIDKVEKGESDRHIIISIDSASSIASTIKVSGLKVDLDRTLAEGPYNFTITGSALNRVAVKNTAGTGYEYAVGNADNLDTKVTDAVASFQGMVVVTPAQDGVVKPVVMTVGSTVYTIDGVEMTMDVAPYIKDSRTYFPVRYVAQALGITTDNVVWDDSQRTVTIFRANRIVQVTIGSRTMLVNGVPLTMDVAPEITSSRTMLPIRFVAQGLGVNVTWDEATRTITLN